jgi:hypothetical protein
MGRETDAINEQRIAAAKDAIKEAIVGLSPHEAQSALLDPLDDAISEGMSDAAHVRLAAILDQEHQRRELARVEEGRGELEDEAKKLAKLIRAEGMGYLHGKFPDRLQEVRNQGGYQSIRGFRQGEDVNADTILDRQILRNTPDGTRAWNHYDNSDRQVWTAIPYGLQIVNDRGHTRRADNMDTTKAQWIQFEYFMPISPEYDRYKRDGNFANLVFVVPPVIAEQIDYAVGANPYFPNSLFQALYPGVVGENTDAHLKRKLAKELLVRDFRKNTDPNEGKLVKYPKPISY